MAVAYQLPHIYVSVFLKTQQPLARIIKEKKSLYSANSEQRDFEEELAFGHVVYVWVHYSREDFGKYEGAGQALIRRNDKCRLSYKTRSSV